MPEDRIDLDGYLARIGYSGPLAPTVETLNGVSLAHVTSIPFDNLAVLLGEPVRLDAASVEQKLVVEGRGGYCFEHSNLILRVLRQLGFEVTPLGGRVRLEIARPAVPPRTHMFLRVEAGGRPYVIDVGFGVLSLGAAMRFEPDLEQVTPHETRRLLVEDGRWFNQARVGGEWRDAYEFTLAEFHPIDQEVANWWTSTSPASRFRNRLSIALAQRDGGRKTIADRRFTIRHADGAADSREIGSPDELLAILGTHFGLRYPAGTRFEIPAAPWPG